MEREVFISMWLDNRRPKESGLFPVKLRVFTPHPRKQMLYSTEFELSKNEFKSVWKTLKPRDEHKALRNKMLGVQLLAEKIAEKITPFSFRQFEKVLLRNSGAGTNIIHQYEHRIIQLKNQNKLGTASNYELSLKSLKAFVESVKGNEPTKILFSDITPEWLEKYEDYMVNTLKRTSTTVGIYLRPLRAVFNTAIAENEIDVEVYPFGVKKYQIPTGSTVKKALSQDELNKLYYSKPKTAEQKKAKDFWFFSYACNGMNIKDIAQLKYKNIEDDKIIFYRAKTIKTSKANSKQVTVYLNDYSKMIIKKYGNKNTAKSEYIFPIIETNQLEALKHNKIKNFTKFINQNLKKLALSIGMSDSISTYWARHSFATSSIRKGASMEFVMEALSHNNMKTTVGYFAGFEDKDKKEFMQNLMNF